MHLNSYKQFRTCNILKNCTNVPNCAAYSVTKPSRSSPLNTLTISAVTFKIQNEKKRLKLTSWQWWHTRPKHLFWIFQSEKFSSFNSKISLTAYQILEVLIVSSSLFRLAEWIRLYITAGKIRERFIFPSAAVRYFICRRVRSGRDRIPGCHANTVGCHTRKGKNQTWRPLRLAKERC